MKKIFILSVILFTYSFTVNAQQKTYSSDDFCKIKWLFKSVNFNGQVMEYTEAQKKDNWMIFHKDGKHQVKSGGKITDGATWEFESKENMFTFKDNGDVTQQKIIKLTKTEMVIEGDFEGKKLTFYLEKEK